MKSIAQLTDRLNMMHPNAKMNASEVREWLQKFRGELENQDPWMPMDQAPLTGRILLRYPNGQVIAGQWDTNEHASRPRPYWTNDLEYIRGKQWTRQAPPIGWMHFPESRP